VYVCFDRRLFIVLKFGDLVANSVGEFLVFLLLVVLCVCLCMLVFGCFVCSMFYFGLLVVIVLVLVCFVCVCFGRLF